MGRTKDKPKNVLKTFYSPNEVMNDLAQQLEALKKYKAQQDLLYNAELDSLKDEQRVREEEIEMRKEAGAEKVAELEEYAGEAEERKNQAFKAYLRLRYAC